MTTSPDRSAVPRLLTRHFLRRFFENDLISPHVDLHENTFVACAAIVSLSLFVSVIVGSTYMIGIAPPGAVVVGSLGHNFFFVYVAMFAMALVAALQWDALSLDARDAANLGPLPIQRGALVRAKLTALTIFAVGFALALTVFASTIFQLLMLVRMPVGITGVGRLALAHFTTSILACVFGFFAVVAAREVSRLLLGERLFGRVSPLLQAALILLCTTSLLMSIGIADRTRNRWLREGYPSAWTYPPLAFLALEQAIGGGIVANVTGYTVPRAMRPANERALKAYRAQQGYYQQSAPIAFVLAGVTFVVGAAAYAWNLRRAPQPVSASGRRRRLAAAAGWLFSGGDSIRRAGFAFALHAIVRSAPHRLAMAGAVALALALSVGFLSKNGFRPTLDPSFPSGYILIVQPVVLTILLAGFRRAVRVPAELRANWIMQMAWRRGERRFLAGVKLAALVGVALPTLAITAAIHVLLISEQMAALRFLTGLVYCLALNEALYTGCKKVPLASSYEPLTNVKTIGPIVFLFFLMFMNSFTRVERAALQTTQGITNFVLVLLAVTIVLRGLDYWLTRGERPMKFDEPPEPSTQWLGLTQ